jgi:hypothetical protein
MTQVQGQSSRSRARRTAALWLPLLLAAVVAGCSAALDWRQLQPDGWSLVAALPCKPASQQRQVVLAGKAVVLTMLACTADDHTFALASAELDDPARVTMVLQALGGAAQANVQGRVAAEQPAAVPGMTPNPAARRWLLQGQLPDGHAVVEQVQVFAHGTRVFQATVIGAAADDARAAPFFEALRVRP